MEKKPLRSKRFEKLAERPVNQEPFIKPWPETGLIVVASPLMIGDDRGRSQLINFRSGIKI